MGIWRGFAPRSDLLCPRRQSKQTAQAALSCPVGAIHLGAAGGGHARFHRAIRAAPRPPVTRGTHDRQPFPESDRRGKRHGLISACRPLPLRFHQTGQAVFLSQMRLVQAVFRLLPIPPAPKEMRAEARWYRIGNILWLTNTQRQRSEEGSTFLSSTRAEPDWYTKQSRAPVEKNGGLGVAG